jgi:inner membrane protein
MTEQAFSWTWAWIIAGVIIAGLEILIPGVFLLWLGLGALATGIILVLVPGLPLAWQALVFAVAMVSSLGLGMWIQRHSARLPGDRFLNKEMKAMIGQRYFALGPFKAGRGRIKVQDTSFAAVSQDEIDEGDLVEVVAISGGRPQVVKVPDGARPGAA